MSCGSCTQCCLFPGIMMPTDVSKLAKFLHLSIDELYPKYLMLVVLGRGKQSGFNFTKQKKLIFGLVPRKKGTKDRIVNHNYNRSHTLFEFKNCIFLHKKKSGCVIHEVKPYACKEYQCEKIGLRMYNHNTIYAAWKKNQKLIFTLIPELKTVSKLSQLEQLFCVKNVSVYED